MEHTLALSHGTLSWDETGSHRAAITLVLLHGFPHDRGLWSAQLAAAEHAFPDTRILMPDLPGFGRSSPLPSASMDAYADALEPMLDAAGVERAVIGGLSMGGYVAFAFWRRHAARVRALILMDTKAPADTEAAREKRRALIDTVTQDGVGAVVPDMLPSQLGATTRSESPAVVERVEVMLRRAPASGVVAAVQALMERPDSTPTLGTITVPTLILVGDEDTTTPPADAIAMAAGIPGSRLVTVPGAGHLSPLEQPTVVNAAIGEFLDVAVRRS
ncbi:MAG: alpha/beta fold hydrolase [Gemmatimonadota bacterium]